MDRNEQQPGTRIERRKEDTRRKVVESAMRLFQEHGFDAVTMEQIANAVDIAKGTLYNHFPVKEAILDEYIRMGFRARYPAQITLIHSLPGTRARMTALLTDLIEGIRRQPVIFERYFSYRIRQMITLKQDETQASGFYKVEAEIIRLGQESGELRADMPFSLLQALFEFAFVEIAQNYYADPAGFDGPRVTAQCVDLFMNGAHR